MPITVQPDLGLLQRPLITQKTAEQQAAEQALTDQRESLAQERKSKLADMRQAAMDTAAARAAWQASIDPKTGQVDYDQLIPNMVKNNASSAAIEKAQTGLDTHFDKQLAQQHLRDEHASAFQDLQSKFISGIDGQDKLDVANQLHPEWGLPKDFKTGEAQIKLMADAATTASVKAKDRIDALKEQRDALKFKTEDLPTAYAKGLQSAAQFVLADDPTNYANAKNGGLKEFGWSKDIIDRLPDPADPQRQQKLEAMARTSEQNATLAGQAAGRAQTQANEAATRAQEQQRIGLERQRVGLEAQRLNQADQEAKGIELKPGTANYRQAQDLADGTLTFADFQRLHSRAQADAPLRAAIYDTARQLNPSFNPAAFEIGYKFASNPKVRQQVASIKNVESGVPDLLKFSDAAARSGSPLLNDYAIKPIQTRIGSGKAYGNFKTAVTAFADELSGALGYGSATDMARDMGFSMTDMSQSPATFKSNIQDVVIPFVARKKASIVGEMGPYAGGANPTTGAGSTPAAGKPATLVYDPVTGTFKKRGG